MKHITKEQRYTISVMKQQGYKQKEIAFAIKKGKGSISRELKRNKNNVEGVYDSEIAQCKYSERQKNKPKKIQFTDKIKLYVEEKIKDDLSPEQIAGRAKVEGIECVSHEKIYQHIWNEKKRGGKLYKHLRRQGKKYRKRGNLKDKRGIIKDRISIDERPKIVDKKKRFGDFEIDTIIGKNHKGAILTINDRWSSLVWIKKLSGKHSEPLTEKTITTLEPFKNLIHTITGDNGKEFAGHKQISEKLELDFYFAHPYHSWERGANENTNGLIRQYIPKKTDFKEVTEEYIECVQQKLNNRPRKKLNFLTPIEYFYKFTKSNINKKVAFVT